MNPRRRALGVLMVEDSLPVRQAFRSTFAALPGVRVIGEAEDATTAMRLIRELRPDVVTLDIKLKRGYGTDVLQQVARDRSGTPPVIIMLSNHTADFLKAHCLAAGARHFFDKATEFEAACEALLALAAGRHGRERSHG